MATSRVTVRFPCPVEQVWQTVTDLTHTAWTMENSNMSGSWEGIFEAEEGGTRLTCTEEVNAKHWWMRPFVPVYLKRQQKLYLDDLQRELTRRAD